MCLMLQLIGPALPGCKATEDLHAVHASIEQLLAQHCVRICGRATCGLLVMRSAMLAPSFTPPYTRHSAAWGNSHSPYIYRKP